MHLIKQSKYYYQMKLLLTLIVLTLFTTYKTVAQCNQQVPLQVINPSFEGTPQPHVTPAPWSTCGVTPDTQPGQWGVNLAPSNGSSYVGFVQGGANWLEGASQQLSGNMIANVTYTFTIDLATTSSSGGGINPGSICGINVYGGNSICNAGSLLWSSPLIAHTSWQTYTVTFTPSQNFSHVYFRIYGAYLGYVLVDNITPFVAQGITITSHVSGASENCSFNLSGAVTGNSTDSVVISGNFVETPLTANLTGLNWTAHLTFNNPGTETIIATSYYTIGGSQYCVFTSIDLTLAPPSTLFSATNVCLNETSQFTDLSSSSGQETVTSWAWTFGDGNTSSLQNPTHLYSTPGTYNVQLQATTNNNCTGSRTIPYTVYVLPLSEAGSDNLLTCSTTSVSLNGGNSDIGTNFNHLWTTNTGNILSGASTTTPTVNHTGIYYITTTNSSTNCVSTDSLTVTIDTLVPLSNAGIDTAINCIPQVQLDGTGSSTGPEYTYLWTTINGTIISGATTFAPTVGSVGNYYLEVTNINNGCSILDTVDVGIDTLHPIVNAGLDTLLTCSHLQINLNGNLSDQGTTFSYNWTTINGGISQGNTNTTPTIIKEGVYYLTVLNTHNNCSSIDSVTIGIDTLHPIAIAGIDSIVTCNIPEITLNATGSSTGNFTYIWQTNNGNILSDSNTLSPAVNAEGIYTIVVTNNYNGCSSSDQVFIASDLTAIINILSSSVSVDEIQGVNPYSVDYSWFGDNGTVNWDFGDNNFSTDSIQDHTYNLPGLYNATIILVDESGCIAYDSILVEVIGREIIFPNIFTPNNDGENDIFTFRGERIKEFNCTIFNRWGQEVYAWNTPVGGWDGRTLAGVEAPSGEYFYILKAVDDTGSIIEKKGTVMLMR